MPRISPRSLILSLASCAVALAGAELFVGARLPYGGLIYRLDETRIHATVPGTRRLQPMPSYADAQRVLVRIGPDGYRGPGLERPKRRKRVVVYGDSLVLAGNTPEDETFVAALARTLGGGAGWEGVNAGLESYGPDQTLLQMETGLPTLEADLVVLVLCAHNDFGDLVRNHLFALEADGTLRPRAITLGPSLRALFRERAARAAAPALVRLWRHARAEVAPDFEPGRDYVTDYLLAARWQYEEFIEGANPLVDDIERDTWDADVALLPDAPSSVFKKALMRAVLARIGALCGQLRVPLLVVVVPSALDVDPEHAIRVDEERFVDYRPRTLSDALVDTARAAGLQVLDLYEPFTAADPSALFVGGTDFHWNIAGQALAARETALHARASALDAR